MSDRLNASEMSAPTESPAPNKSKLVTEADNSNSDGADQAGETDRFMAERKDMLASMNKDDDKDKVQLKPMGPLAASSTVVNLLLATGPFS